MSKPDYSVDHGDPGHLQSLLEHIDECHKEAIRRDRELAAMQTALVQSAREVRSHEKRIAERDQTISMLQNIIELKQEVHDVMLEKWTEEVNGRDQTIADLQARVSRLKGLLIDSPYPACGCEFHLNLMKRISEELKEE